MNYYFANRPMAISPDEILHLLHEIDEVSKDEVGKDEIDTTSSEWAFVEIRGTLGNGWRCDTEYDDIREALEQAKSESKPVCLLINSYGGEVVGCDSLARQIADYPFEKIAYIDGACESAAYYLASGVDKIFSTPSSTVGCVGVMQTLVDFVESDKEEGVNFRIIRSRDAKATYNPHEEITDAVEADCKKILNEYDAIFYEFVTANRPKKAEQGLADLNGATVLASEAKRIGLIDDIIPYFNVLADKMKANQANNILSSEGNMSGKVENEAAQTAVTSNANVAVVASGALSEKERIKKIIEMGRTFSVSEKTTDRAISEDWTVEMAQTVFTAAAEERGRRLPESAGEMSGTSIQRQANGNGGGNSNEPHVMGGRIKLADLIAAIKGDK